MIAAVDRGAACSRPRWPPIRLSFRAVQLAARHISSPDRKSPSTKLEPQATAEVVCDGARPEKGRRGGEPKDAGVAKLGIRTSPVHFSTALLSEGSCHCAPLDIRRRGELESYFDNSSLSCDCRVRLRMERSCVLLKILNPARLGSTDVALPRGKTRKRHHATFDGVRAGGRRFGKTEVVEKVRPLKPKLLGNTHFWLEM
jgi:hypothetical protein